ncbi:MAG: hypothetical protein ACNA8P_03550 [Phycisphaerales bacterium]
MFRALVPPACAISLSSPPSLSPPPPPFPPPFQTQMLRFMGVGVLSLASLVAGACVTIPPEASQLAIASSSAVDTLRAEHSALVRAVSESRRIEIDAQFSSIYADAEAAVRTRHNLSPDAPLSQDHRLDIAAIAIGVRDDLLSAIAQTEAELLARSDLHHAHARRMTDALSAYLLARTNSDDLRAALSAAAARRLGIDPAALDPAQVLDELLDSSIR